MLRLAKVPTPRSIAAVSPWMTRTCCMGTFSASEITCANDVSCPWPWLCEPVTSVT